MAVIVGVQDEDEIERLLLAYSPRLRAILEASRKQIREGDVLSHEEFWAEVEASRSSKPRPEAEAGLIARPFDRPAWRQAARHTKHGPQRRNP